MIRFLILVVIGFMIATAVAGLGVTLFVTFLVIWGLRGLVRVSRR